MSVASDAWLGGALKGGIGSGLLEALFGIVQRVVGGASGGWRIVALAA